MKKKTNNLLALLWTFCLTVDCPNDLLPPVKTIIVCDTSGAQDQQGQERQKMDALLKQLENGSTSLSFGALAKKEIAASQMGRLAEALKENKSLIRLDLSHVQIKDDGLEKVAGKLCLKR